MSSNDNENSNVSGETKTPILWTIPRVENIDNESGLYQMIEQCDENCDHPAHGFQLGRERHIIEAELVETASENNWWNDVVKS